MSNSSSIQNEDTVTALEISHLKRMLSGMVQQGIPHPEFFHVVEELLHKEKRWMREEKRKEERKQKEEMKRKEEGKQKEEQKQKEEVKRREELRLQEKLKQQEELKRQRELERKEELRWQDELKRKEARERNSMQFFNQIQPKKAQRIQITGDKTLYDYLRTRTAVKRPLNPDPELQSSEKRVKTPQTETCKSCKKSDAHCEVEEGSRRCKRCTRGHIKCVFESRVLAQNPEKAVQKQEKNKGKAKEDRQNKTGEVGDNRGIEALMRELIVAIPAWKKAIESVCREVIAGSEEMKARRGIDFQAQVLQELKSMENRVRVLEFKLVKEARAKENGGS